MDIESPYWYKLIRHFEVRGYVQNGLTVPFLLGSFEIIAPGEKHWTISEMLESLNRFGCTILRCSNIKEFVIGSLDSETNKFKEVYYNPCGNIIVTDDSLDNVISINELTSLFIDLYQELLNKKEFSKNNGMWTYFTPLDIERIEELIK